MTKRPPLLLIGTLALAACGCGHRGDPRPPLRRTPPAPTEFRLTQRGSALELTATAPAASVDAVALTQLALEFVHGSGTGDLDKTGARTLVKAAPGARVSSTLPLPAPGTLVRAAARAVASGERGARTLTMALVAQPPIAPPSELAAVLAEDGVKLAWHGVRPKEVPPPVGPSVPGRPGVSGKGVPGPAGAPGSKPGTPPTGGAAAAAGTGPAATATAPSGPGGPPAQAGAPTKAADAGKPPAAAAPGKSSGSAAAATVAAAAPGTPPAPGTAAASKTGAEAAEPKAEPKARRSGFYLYRRTGNEAYTTPLAEEPLDRRTLTDAQAPLGVRVCYVVRAVASTDPLIESTPSNEVCLERKDITPPATPAGLAVLPRQGGLELLWSPSAEDDLAGYRVYRASGDAAPQRLAELSPGKAAYLDESVQKGVTYRYTLTAFDQAANESPPTEPVEAALP